MSQGAQSQPGQDPYVLLISDRPAEKAALVRGIAVALQCQAVCVGEPLPSGHPIAAVLDLDVAGVKRAEAALAARSDGVAVPRIVLHRGVSKPPASSAALLVLSASAPIESILSRIFAVIDGETQARAKRARRLQANGVAANGIVADLFDSAAIGAGLQHAAIDQGTEIVLESIAESGINAWLAAVWRHDFGIYQHTLGVAGYAGAFGGQIGLSLPDRRRLAKAALLHDIGKSRIPADILNKPGALTPEEWRLMQRHPSIGSDLLLAQGGFEPAVIGVVRHHHERLDGTGYPDGLAGAAIADLVRIVAICDVFAALTERRAYRRPLGAPEALTLMEQTPGHLDPALLRAFRPVGLRATMVPS